MSESDLCATSQGLHVGSGLHLSLPGVVQEGWKGGEPGEGQPVQAVDELDGLRQFIEVEASLVSRIEDILPVPHPEQDLLDPVPSGYGPGGFQRLVPGKDRPVLRRQARRLACLGSRHLHEVPQVSQPVAVGDDGPRACHVHGHITVRAAVGDRPKSARRPSHLFAHRIDLQAPPLRFGRHETGVRLQGVEVQHVAVGGDQVVLVELDRCLQEGPVPGDQGIKEHRHLRFPTASSC